MIVDTLIEEQPADGWAPRETDPSPEMLLNAVLHDVLNTAGTICGAAELLELAEESQRSALRQMLLTNARRLKEEILAHWNLVTAERGQLVPRAVSVSSLALLRDLAVAYAVHPAARGRALLIAEGAEDVRLCTDPVLVGHVVANMVKNALEAEPPGATVTLRCAATVDGVRFEVHNPTQIAPELQTQLFTRTVSTKGPRRGIGTWAMKLFGERCLGGKVRFSSNDTEGTTFRLELPWTAGRR